MAATAMTRPEEQHDDGKRRRHRDDEMMRSPIDAKRLRRDDRVSSYAADRKRKSDGRDRERYSSVRGSRGGDHRRRYSSSSCRVSCTRRSHARRTPENRDDERTDQRDNRRRSRSPAPESKTRPQVIPCGATAPQTQPMATPYPRDVAHSQPPAPEDLTEQFEETELRRREIQRKREEARREMDKVVQSVYFNDDPFVSLMDALINR